MIVRKILIILVTLLFVYDKNLLADIKILVSVDNEIITNHDIKKESNYLEILNPNLIQLNNNQRFILAKNSIINQIIKEKEIKKFLNVDSKNSLINDYLEDLYSKLGFSSEQEFETMLKQKRNYNLSEIKKKIKIELLWNELIFSRYSDQIKINKNEIIAKIDALKKDSKKSYLLSEIVFSKKQNITIEELFEEITLSINEIGFGNTANIYSNSDSSKFGGKIGWINEVSLSKQIKKKLRKVNIGEFTDLIKLGNDFVILKIEDIKIEKSIIDEKKEIEKLIKLETNKQLSKYSKVYFNKSKLNYSINEK
jgi:peptidyl-prolyl cis-trans isomerase SurA